MRKILCSVIMFGKKNVKCISRHVNIQNIKNEFHQQLQRATLMLYVRLILQ